MTLVWNDGAEKQVALPVPFGCDVADIRAEAETALRSLSIETGAIAVNSAP